MFIHSSGICIALVLCRIASATQGKLHFNPSLKDRNWAEKYTFPHFLHKHCLICFVALEVYLYKQNSYLIYEIRVFHETTVCRKANGAKKISKKIKITKTLSHMKLLSIKWKSALWNKQSEKLLEAFWPLRGITARFLQYL